jgi:hypothetical protein
VSVVAYDLLQICNILRSRVGNSTQKLREFAVFFHSDGLCQILPAAHSSGFHPSVGRPTLIIAFRRAVIDLCAAGPKNIFLRGKMFDDFGLPLTLILSFYFFQKEEMPG